MQAVGPWDGNRLFLFTDSWHMLTYSYPRGLSAKTAKERHLFSMKGSQALNDLNCCRFGSERLLDGRTIWCIHPKSRLQPSRSFPESQQIFQLSRSSRCLPHLHFLRLWLKSQCPVKNDVNKDAVWRWIHAEALILLGRLQEAVEVWDGKAKVI